MEIVKNKFEIIDNMLIVTLEDEEIQDNMQYEIRLKNFKSVDEKATLDNITYKVVTKMSPAYCKVSDVAILVDVFNIPESTILYYIREASKYVNYIMEVDEVTEITFPVTQFVKTKVMIDCLLKAYVHKAAGSGLKGTLGVISFENTEKYATTIDDLLDDLYKQLKGWEDALRGFEFEGRVAPVYAVKASKTTNNTAFSTIVTDITRDMPTV